MRQGAGCLRAIPWVCAALAGCASDSRTVAPTVPAQPPVVVTAPASVPVAAASLPASASDHPESLLESLDPEIWQDLLELDAEAILNLEPDGADSPAAR